MVCCGFFGLGLELGLGWVGLMGFLEGRGGLLVLVLVLLLRVWVWAGAGLVAYFSGVEMEREGCLVLDWMVCKGDG